MNTPEYTPGPWGIEQTISENWIGPLRPDGKISQIVCHTERGLELKPSALARNDINAVIIADAPAMRLALEMLSAGVARIERSPSCALVEFCFGGFRYIPHADNWTRLLDTIGWDKARAAVAKVEGAQ